MSDPTTTSADLARRAERTMPGGVSSPVRATRRAGDAPLFIARGRGSRVFEHEGASLIDYICSWGAAIVGHANPDVVEAVQRLARAGLGFGARARPEIELAEEIVRRVPSIERVRFVCSGTEAVMSALRLARAATGRDRILKFKGGYHGHADGLLAQAGSGVAALGTPACPGVTPGVAKDTVTIPHHHLEALRAAFDTMGDRLAAAIVEPVAGNMSVVPATRAFLDELRTLTRRHGAVLVFDEVITGFRLSRSGAQGPAGITPDLTTMGKIVGGGLPLAAFGGSAALMEQIAPSGPVYQAGTLSGNPIAAAAGLATLRQLDDEAYARLERLSSALASGIRAAGQAAGVELDVQRAGSMLGVLFSATGASNWDDLDRADHDASAALFRAMRRRGALIPPNSYESWFLSTAHSDADVRATVEIFEQSLMEIRGEAAPLPRTHERSER